MCGRYSLICINDLWVGLVERAVRKNKEVELSAGKERLIVPCPIL
jgi:hypothetical protein